MDTTLMALGSAPPLSFLGWIIFGGLAGWLASVIMKTNDRTGIVLNVVVGVIGGLIGGWILALFGVDTVGHGWWFSFLTCLLGAIILLGIVRVVTPKR
ncbi:GlsB/YeaQ/YmgE family stress response membrane protein [Corynebacterium nuruki]|uniref:GlsB/YeaQ/YmgE family stress response membrane protein n=1 Tax=Corynebacterium nuruki TaxID=1032851 RepID=A0A3D4SWT1_9CORY|nr:GlsB/YeaQ/YmgE family stress response membrane protein [Corynebacterium nuruki]MDN6439114.1 GlsB/YeaQ/YmgE family stress response membrane protein [Corynebacterium nuruki]HCT13461.1 GlsB/YeaQ/YmgE family stress response membrane protein [Corynebacterium nuruki]